MLTRPCVADLRAIGLMTAVVALFTILVSLPFADAQTADESGRLNVNPVRIVLLVDESGSMDETGVASERQAATVIALSDMSNESEVAILGFGSTNGPGQAAVTDYCGGFVELTTLGRELLVDCIGGIHERDSAEGNDTDHRAALSAAADLLEGAEGDGRAQIVFLLTDGVLDVSNSPQYGPDGDSRTAQAQRLIDAEVLPRYRSSDLQLWPLGFGAGVDPAALRSYAEGGALPQPCPGEIAYAPAGIVVADLAEVTRALTEALAISRCQEVEDAGEVIVPAGGAEVAIEVDVPAFATDGAIIVTKGARSITTTFIDPDGVTMLGPADTIEGQDFERSSSDFVDTLRVTSPKPGTWSVRLSGAREDFLAQALVVWEGRVQTQVFTQPTIPKPGEEFGIEVRLITREGVVVDSSDLEGYEFTAEVISDDGIFRATSPPLQNDGVGFDRRADDSIFSGSVVLPASCSGGVTVRGIVAGPGVTGDVREHSFSCDQPFQFSIAAEADFPSTVAHGDRLPVSFTAFNGGPPVDANIVLVDLKRTGGLALEGSTDWLISTESGIDKAVELVVRESAALAPAAGEIQVVGGDGIVLERVPFNFSIEGPPTFWETWRWLLLFAIGMLLMAAVALLRWRGERKRRMDPKGLVVALLIDGVSQDSIDAPKTGAGREFFFSIDGREIRRAPASAELGDRYQVSRTSTGYEIELPTGEVSSGSFNERIDIESPMGQPQRQLVVSDTRPNRGSSSSTSRGGRRPNEQRSRGRASSRAAGSEPASEHSDSQPEWDEF